MKRIATLTVAAAIMALTGSAAYAQSNDAQGKAPQHERMDRSGSKVDWQAKRADMQRFMEARIAGVPAGLKLTADQQKLWIPVEAALKANMKAHSDFMEKAMAARKDAKEHPDYITRLDLRNQVAQMAAQNSKNLLDAMKPFWASLDDGQKKLLPPLIQPHGGMRGKGRMQRMRMMGDHDGMSGMPMGSGKN